jgi:hypothetical protein
MVGRGLEQFDEMAMVISSPVTTDGYIRNREFGRIGTFVITTCADHPAAPRFGSRS